MYSDIETRSTETLHHRHCIIDIGVSRQCIIDLWLGLWCVTATHESQKTYCSSWLFTKTYCRSWLVCRCFAWLTVTRDTRANCDVSHTYEWVVLNRLQVQLYLCKYKYNWTNTTGLEVWHKYNWTWSLFNTTHSCESCHVHKWRQLWSLTCH